MRVVFMGSPEFAVPALEAVRAAHEIAVVVTQPDKRAGRGRKFVPPPVKVAALEAGLPVEQPRSMRTPEALEMLRSQQADVAVVVAYGKILPKAVLEVFPHGCVNIHGSLLPAYRGAAPMQRSIMAGDSETGVSIMRLDEGMDTGPVYRMVSEPILDDDTTLSLGTRLATIGAEAIRETLAELNDGTATTTPQDDSAASHAAMLTKQDGEIDWTRPASLVSAHVRGVDPWPCAFSLLGDDVIKLFAPTVATNASGEPGQVLSIVPEGLTVACGEGAVTFADAQAPGKRRMAAIDFARGRRLEVGAQFGHDD